MNGRDPAHPNSDLDNTLYMLYCKGLKVQKYRHILVKIYILL